MKILIETSARHVHLTKEALEILFGKGAELTNKKDLSQPGQFLSFEKVSILTPKGEIKNVSILGPTRSINQVEVSLTDARRLGLIIPVRESGCIEDTPGCKLVGPKGIVKIDSGVIVAQRHIHLAPENAQRFGLKDKQVVSVRVDTEERPLTFENVVCRVREDFLPAMHIDTDEANAACIHGEVYGEIIV